MPLSPPYLTTERLVLRPATPADAAAVWRYVTDNREFLGPWEPLRTARYYTLGFVEDQIRQESGEVERGTGYRFYLFRRDDPTCVVGMINATNIVRGAGQYCTLGYSLGENAQGHGYMTEALSAVVRFCFESLCLHRVQANYIPRNERSGRVLRRAGFVIEGYARDYLFINEKWEDHILTAITNPDWKPGF